MLEFKVRLTILTKKSLFYNPYFNRNS